MIQICKVIYAVVLLTSLSTFERVIHAHCSVLYSERHLFAQSSNVNLREIEGLQIRRIEFSGNDKTNDYVVRRLFAMREGEPFGAGCWKEAFVG